MIDREPILVLPLVHHLVNQRLDRLAPPVSSNVTAADCNLGSLAGRIAMRVMPKPALHPTRYPDWNPGE